MELQIYAFYLNLCRFHCLVKAHVHMHVDKTPSTAVDHVLYSISSVLAHQFFQIVSVFLYLTVFMYLYHLFSVLLIL